MSNSSILDDIQNYSSSKEDQDYFEFAYIKLNGYDITDLSPAHTKQFKSVISLLEKKLTADDFSKKSIQKLSKALSKVISSLRPNDTKQSESNSESTQSSQEQEISLEDSNLSFLETQHISDRDVEIQNQFSIEDTLGPDFLLKFASIQKSNLEELEQAILSLETGETEANDIINRILHTLKGDFGVLGLSYYSQLVHHVEDLFLKGNFNVDQLFKLKDFFEIRFEEFSNLNVLAITETDVASIFNFSESISRTEVITTQSTIKHLPFNHDLGVLKVLKDEPEIAEDFIVESLEHLNESENLLMQLENDLGSIEIINTLFRVCHTIKGVAGFLDLQVITLFSHELENKLSKARKSEITLTKDDISLLLEAFDVLEQLILSLREGLSTGVINFPEPIDRLYNIFLNNGANIQLEASDSTANSESLDQQEPIQDNNKVPQHNTSTSSISTTAQSKDKPSPNPKNTNPIPPNKSNSSSHDDTIRVQTEKLDQLIDAIGETVIAQSMIAADPIIKGAEDLILDKKIAQSNLLIRQIQELSMSLRMVPVKGTFQKMARLVRDLSKKMDKAIDFVMEGENTELDKTVVEKIADPLMHMVRNSVDHGIETKEERDSSSKDPTAKIILRSYNKGGSIFIEIEDDGKGLNKDVILQKAINNGLIQNDEGLSDQEIYRFIFNPGFSTAQKVTDLSGRGVGMDVVKKNIESLRGSIGISSSLGQGTIFSIRLPLTLAIIDGMVVKSQEQLFVLPTLSMLETVKANPEEIIKTHDGTKMLKIRGSLIPICQLDRTLGFNNSELDVCKSIIVIVEDMVGTQLGVVVDEIIGQQQIVIKSLGKWVGEIPGLAGGTIMNNGNVSLIVDIAGLQQMYQSNASKPSHLSKEKV